MVILRDIKHDHGRKAVNAAGNVEQASSSRERGVWVEGEGRKEVRERTGSKSRPGPRKNLVLFQTFVAWTAKKPVGIQGCVPRQAGR